MKLRKYRKLTIQLDSQSKPLKTNIIIWIEKPYWSSGFTPLTLPPHLNPHSPLLPLPLLSSTHLPFPLPLLTSLQPTSHLSNSLPLPLPSSPPVPFSPLFLTPFPSLFNPPPPPPP